MLVGFFDDSKTDKNKWLGLGGYVIKGDLILKLENEINRILIDNNVPINKPDIDTEIKWSPKRTNWFHYLEKNKRVSLYRKLLSILPRYGAVYICGILHTERIKKDNICNWINDVEAYRKAMYKVYTLIFERAQEWAKYSDVPCILICDVEKNRTETKAVICGCLELIEKGSDYLEMPNLYRHPWMVDSRLHRTCQLADLIIGIKINMVAGESCWDYARLYWDLLQGRFMKLPHLPVSQPQRYGMQILPTPERVCFIRKCNPYLGYF